MNTKDKLLPPTTLHLTNNLTSITTTSGTVLYTLSRNVTTPPKDPQNSTVVLSRLEDRSGADKKEDIYYLAHPSDAKYGKWEGPAYYITSVEGEDGAGLGNVYFETCPRKFQKTEFKALLCPGRHAGSRPLFDELGKERVEVFKARAGMMSSGSTWTDSAGEKVAIEESKKENKLGITASMGQRQRDALVALWVLRIWYEWAESRAARREEMDRWTVPVPPNGHDKMGKRVGALGALGAAGGGGGC